MLVGGDVVAETVLDSPDDVVAETQLDSPDSQPESFPVEILTPPKSWGNLFEATASTIKEPKPNVNAHSSGDEWDELKVGGSDDSIAAMLVPEATAIRGEEATEIVEVVEEPSGTITVTNPNLRTHEEHVAAEQRLLQLAKFARLYMELEYVDKFG